MRIIPAIDIIDGKCVRLTKGNYAEQKVYFENPLDAAWTFEDAGLTYLHLVDLDGAKAGQVVNWKVAEAICAQTSLAVDFGGGIKQQQDIERLLGLGVKQVNIGSAAVRNPELVKEWISRYGSEKVILSADVKDGQVAIHGWQSDSGLLLNDLLVNFRAAGLQYVACTDISRDGMLAGANLKLYRELTTTFPDLRIIASGGVTTLNDLTTLKSYGVDGAIIGKAIYEGTLSLADLATPKYN